MLTWQSENASACVAYSPPGAMTSDAARNRFSGVENDAASSRQILGRPVVTRKAKFYQSQTVTEHHMVGQVWGSGWWLHRAQLEGTRCAGAGGREEEHTSARCRPLSTMADIYDRAEELNQVSALYNVEIDGVPLQQMSTNELAKVRCAPHAPLDVAVELAHFARDASPETRRV